MQIEKLKWIGIAGTLLAQLTAATGTAVADGYQGLYGFGTAPTEAEISAINIDAMPDGRGLPPGQGTYLHGKEIFAAACAACHGENLEGVKEVSGPALIGGRGTIGSTKMKATVESYWPYAPTIFDYVKRAMPFNAPGSLTDDEVYSVVAYILGKAKIISVKQKIDAKTLPAIEMPNRDGFIPDARPDVFNYN